MGGNDLKAEDIGFLTPRPENKLKLLDFCSVALLLFNGLVANVGATFLADGA